MLRLLGRLEALHLPLSSSRRPVRVFAAERELLRRELCRHFGKDPKIADSIFLRTWRSGERRNQPKIPPAVQTMLERGLVELRITTRGPRVFFTETGLAALRQLVFDRRAMDPERSGHLRVEPGAGVSGMQLTVRPGAGEGAAAIAEIVRARGPASWARERRWGLAGCRSACAIGWRHERA